MATVLDAFSTITNLLSDVNEKVQVLKDPDNEYFIEAHPMQAGGQIWAKTFGPFESEEDGEQFLKAKYDRNRVRAAAHFGSGGKIENDGMAICHPEFRYRYINANEYLARYLAQIGVTVMGGLVEITRQPDTDQEFRELSEEITNE